MLTAIECVKFRAGRIELHGGLNVVLGDSKATNSIGKSTLLMVIDFAFGGSSLLSHNNDILPELGHHSYKFTFQFGSEKYYFERFTDQLDVVFVSDENWHAKNPLPLAKYCALLKSAYGIESDNLSFRSLVGLYSRIWGKENLDVHHPLHIVKSQSARECVDNFIKAFNLYESIQDLADSLAVKEKERDALRSAFKNRLLPKIGKRQHQDNERKIHDIESEIQSIKMHLARYAANINQLVDQRMLTLKSQRDDLLAARTRIQSRLLRTRKNIDENRHIKSRHFSALLEYFPEINTNRLAEVEEFHNGVAKLLRGELNEAETRLKASLLGIDAQILAIDERMSSALTSIAQPSEIIDRVYELSNNWSQAKGENEYYQRSENVTAQLTDIASGLKVKKMDVLATIQRLVNSRISSIVKDVYGHDRKSPTLILSEGNYRYEVFEDTGTGTAYSALLMLDLAVFASTSLPCVAHDSVMFKNVENESVANLIKIYLSIEKQSFIAIDEAAKYGEYVMELLNQRAVIKLSDSQVLFIKDWRSPSKGL